MGEDDRSSNFCPKATTQEDLKIETPMLLRQSSVAERQDVSGQTSAGTDRSVAIGACFRYGDFMSPLDIEALSHLLSQDEQNDQDVIRFLHLCDVTSRAEKISEPGSWSVDEQVVYGRGDWQKFSRMRGYTEKEISEFGEFITLSNALDLKYGPDYAISLSHFVDVHTRKCE